MTFAYKYWGCIIFVLSIIAISSALIAEYMFNLLPCKMCLYQRYPYYFIIIIFLFFYFLKKSSNIWLYILIEMSIFYGLFYSIWHVGIEQKLLKGSLDCTGILKKTNSTDNLKDQIINQPIIDCGNVGWYVFGLSAATLNTVLLLFILLLNTIFITKVYYGKEKN